jgi:hypothetical protein
MLALARTLRRAIRANNESAIGPAYLDLSDRIGPVKAMALAHRFWRSHPWPAD